MKERPILFSAPMVRAIIDGSKTQTRRALKQQPWYPIIIPTDPDTRRFQYDDREPMTEAALLRECPYGQPGNRLWVRETWSIEMLGAFGTPEGYESTYEIQYRAGGDDREIQVAPGEFDPYIKFYDSQRGDWRPSIHMPRWASRILLEIVSVRAERLQDISESDACAEGVEPELTPVCCGQPHREDHGVLGVETYCCGSPEEDALAVPAFKRLWESISGTESWTANPWVWVVEFKKVES